MESDVLKVDDELSVNLKKKKKEDKTLKYWETVLRETILEVLSDGHGFYFEPQI